MKYQALKRLKTKTKVLKVCDTLKEAHEVIKNEGAIFDSFSYIGGFPIYAKYTTTNKEPTFYNIQGLHEGYNIVLGLDDKEKLSFNFNS